MAKRGREEKAIMQRKLARKRFRTLIRAVYFNRIWLSSDEDDHKMSLNVKRNIALLVRTQRKIGILTMAEKTLLRSHPDFRSIEDRQKLVTLVAGLKCFSKFPPKVRARLVPVIHYMYVNAGRTLIREGETPYMVYFILTGEVEVTKQIYDSYNDSYSDKLYFISGPGDTLGDIDMLEGFRRTHTYTATTDVEMLVLFDDDYDRILKPIMSKMWSDQKSALRVLGYFDYMSEAQNISACKLGYLRQYDPLETIYYEDRGPLSFVHFVISGECMILQCLKMNVTIKNGRKSYKLVSISKDKADDMFQDLNKKELLQALKEGTTTQKEADYDLTGYIESAEDLEREKTKRSLLRRMDIKGIEILCGLRKPSSEISESNKGSIHSKISKLHENEMPTEDNKYQAQIESLHDIEQEHNIYEHNPDFGKTAEKETQESTRDSHANISKSNNEMQKENLNLSNELNQDSLQTKQQKSNESINSSNSTSTQLFEKKSYYSTSAKEEVSKKLENHFIDVGTLSTGAIFGLGEEMEHRVIMARNSVQCLLIPRFWLFEKEQNPGNFWKRRQFYLDCNIPSREKLFQDFLDTNRWQKFKEDFVKSIYTESRANPTKIQDIPVIGRIVEASSE